LVELKNGETYNGHLANCDAWMNIYLTQVICTSRDGDRFWKMPECFIRGSTIKFLRIPDEVIDNFKEDSSNRPNMKSRGEFSARPGVGRGGGAGGQRGGKTAGGGNRPGRPGSMSSSASNSSINKNKK
jgi:U6 snRNA-associated Sm-like protein LSm4